MSDVTENSTLRQRAAARGALKQVVPADVLNKSVTTTTDEDEADVTTSPPPPVLPTVKRTGTASRGPTR